MVDVYRVTAVLSGVAGGPCYLTGHFNASAGTAQQAADAWFTLVAENSATTTSGAVWSIQNSVPVFDEVTGQVSDEESVTHATVTGGNVTDPCPRYVQGLIKWRTNDFVDGRRVRGRTAKPDVFEVQSEAGVPSAAYINGINPRLTAFFANPNIQHGIWHRQRDASAGPPPVTASDGKFCVTTGGDVWNQWSLLKSRR